MVGKKIEALRNEKKIKQKDFISKMQTMGCDINPTSYSKLEGQIRSINDYELIALSDVLGVSVNWLLGIEK